MRPLLALAALSLSALPATALSADESSSIASPVGKTQVEPQGTYWLRNREGWFWYSDPPASVKTPKAAPPPPSRPPELVEFEAMQQRLDELKRVAVMNPTDTNLVAYMRYQRFVMNKSEVFAERWQRLVWTVPELDYGLAGRPTNSMAIGAFDEQQQVRQGQVVRNLASTHGLLFIFRSDCPYCHRFAPILKRFEQEFSMTVFPVSLDGRGLPEYPNPQMDNGIASRLNATVVPALYLTAPSKRQIRPVGFGVMALTELLERIAALAQDPREAPL
ncbi:MAG: conjugal transfer protein TraF [Bradyrhizobium sp.]|uniref:conjugal transfer protein TraF n=1 Tax=Bradyrhizobium sp. TaxID=376 RepID=UPI003D0A9179